MKHTSYLHLTYRAARRVVVAVTGGTVIAIGILMIFLPGPAMVVIPAGLGILGLEFAWARRWLRKIRNRMLAQLRTREKDTTPEAASLSEAPGVKRALSGPPGGRPGLK